jgi:hypothetical protein
MDANRLDIVLLKIFVRLEISLVFDEANGRFT